MSFGLLLLGFMRVVVCNIILRLLVRCKNKEACGLRGMEVINIILFFSIFVYFIYLAGVREPLFELNACASTDCGIPPCNLSTGPSTTPRSHTDYWPVFPLETFPISQSLERIHTCYFSGSSATICKIGTQPAISGPLFRCLTNSDA